MPLRLYDMPDIEPSRLVGFAGNRIDRLSEKRSDTASSEALAEDSARIMVLGRGKLFMDVSDESTPRALFSHAEAEQFSPDFANAIFLGRQDGAALLSVHTNSDPETLEAPLKALDYRSIYLENRLPGDIIGALAEAAALDSWHGNHRYCGRCGGLSEMRAGGFKRACPQCNAEHFPRTDPVAIMLGVRGDKCILARSPHFAPGMYSCLAGFIEPGETIEAAVRRESLEEMGVTIGRVAYHASQPWPFPYSLMIGCHAEILSDDFSVDRSELEDGRWFSKQEVLTMLDRTHPEGLMTPPPGAIAAHLIRSWAEE